MLGDDLGGNGCLTHCVSLPGAIRAELDPADIVDLLRELIAGMRELRAAVAPDLAQRGALLGALHDAFGGAAFTALDALELAAAAPAGAQLPLSLIALTGSPAGGLRRLSRRLAKLVGRPAGGLALTRIGDDHGSALYTVTQNGQ